MGSIVGLPGLRPGTKGYLCAECGIVVGLTPPSEELVREGLRVLCLECGAKVLDSTRGELQPPTARQREELRKAGFNDDEIDDALTLVRIFGLGTLSVALDKRKEKRP